MKYIIIIKYKSITQLAIYLFFHYLYKNNFLLVGVNYGFSILNTNQLPY